MAFFMLGFPDDNYNTIKESEKFIDQTKPRYTTFDILTPFPGSEIYDDFKQKGLVNDNFDWSKLDYDRATLPAKNLSISEVNSEYLRLKKKYRDAVISKRFNMWYLIYKAFIELKDFSFKRINFLLFKLWHYLKMTVYDNLLKR